MAKNNIVLLLIITAVAIALLYSGGYLKSVASSSAKDYSLNTICQTQDTCLSAIKQKMPQFTDEQVRQSFGCDPQGCFWIGMQEVAKK